MQNDGRQIGRVLTRRQAMALLGGVGAAFILGCRASAQSMNGTTATTTSLQPLSGSAPTSLADIGCVVRPEMTEGPYFVDGQLNRSDIRSAPTDGTVQAGVPLTLAVNVSRLASNTCSPLSGAQVDIWHCDAHGVYSGVADAAQGFNTVGKKFLRGYQVTDDSGSVNFLTIFPGWYTGRTVHIHFKIRTTIPANESYEFTSQFFFDERSIDQVYTVAPYASTGKRDMTNAADGASTATAATKCC